MTKSSQNRGHNCIPFVEICMPKMQRKTSVRQSCTRARAALAPLCHAAGVSACPPGTGGARAILTCGLEPPCPPGAGGVGGRLL